MSITIVRGPNKFLRGYHAAQDLDEIYEYMFRPKQGFIVYDYANGDIFIEEVVFDEFGDYETRVLDNIPEDIDYPLPDEYKED